MQFPRPLFCLVLACLALSWSSLTAGNSLPEFGNHEWVNSDPLTPDGLKGKMAIIRFYEESCPTCRASWAAVNSAAEGWKKDKHLILIAVNSGNSKAQVQGYAQSVKLDNWRVLVDEDRSFEKNFGFTISLQNIFQAYFLAPDGTITPIAPAEPAMSTMVQQKYDEYKGSAKWKIDPEGIPENMQPLWQAFELDQWKQVNQLLPAAMRSTEPKVKDLAAKVDGGIKELIAARLAAAKEKVDAGDKWSGYKIYETLVADFPSRAEIKEATAQVSKLRSDRKVNLEFTGRDVYRKGLVMYADPNQKKNGEVYLQSVIDNYKDTEAADLAKKALGK